MKKRIKVGTFTTKSGDRVHLYTDKFATAGDVDRITVSVYDYHCDAKLYEKIARDLVRVVVDRGTDVPVVLHDQLVNLGRIKGWIK